MNSLCKTCPLLASCDPEKKGYVEMRESWKAACGQGNLFILIMEWFR